MTSVSAVGQAPWASADSALYCSTSTVSHEMPEHFCSDSFQAGEGTLPHEFMEGVEGVAGGFIYTVQGKLSNAKANSV